MLYTTISFFHTLFGGVNKFTLTGLSCTHEEFPFPRKTDSEYRTWMKEKNWKKKQIHWITNTWHVFELNYTKQIALPSNITILFLLWLNQSNHEKNHIQQSRSENETKVLFDKLKNNLTKTRIVWHDTISKSPASIRKAAYQEKKRYLVTTEIGKWEKEASR